MVIPFIIFALGAFFVFVNFYTASTVLPLYIVELGGTEFDIGLQTIFFYITSILCRFYFGPLTDRKGRKLPLTVGAFIFCTAPLFFWLSNNVIVLLFARMYQAIGLAAFFSSAATLAADYASPGRVGFFMGLYRLIFTLALLSGPSVILLGLGIMVLFPTAVREELLILSSVLSGIGYTAGIAVFMAWLIDETEEEIRGTVLAIQESVFDLFFGLGSFIFGCITTYMKMDWSFLLAGGVIFVAGIVIMVKNMAAARANSLRDLAEK